MRNDVASGRFRRDLYYRLATFELKLPSLREVIDDLPRIAQHLLDKAAVPGSRAMRFSAAALGAMRWYPWPGNVRELRNVVERAIILCDGEEIGPEHLTLPDVAAEPRPVTWTPQAPEPANKPAAEGEAVAGGVEALADVEWRMIQHALRAHSGNKTAAARSLGISLRTLYNKLDARAGQM